MYQMTFINVSALKNENEIGVKDRLFYIFSIPSIEPDHYFYIDQETLVDKSVETKGFLSDKAFDQTKYEPSWFNRLTPIIQYTITTGMWNANTRILPIMNKLILYCKEKQLCRVIQKKVLINDKLYMINIPLKSKDTNLPNCIENFGYHVSEKWFNRYEEIYNMYPHPLFYNVLKMPVGKKGLIEFKSQFESHILNNHLYKKL